MSKKGFAALVAAVVIAIAAAVVSQRQADVADGAAAGPMFPDLMDSAAEITRVLVKKPGETATLVRGEDGWVVEEKDGYPAGTAKIRQLVMGLAQLQRVEAKTKNPQRYERLGVAGIDAPDSDSTLVQLLDSASTNVAAVIIGRRQASPAAAGRMSYYVRRADDPQSWLVEGNLPEMRSTIDWLDKGLLELGDDRVRSVTVEHADGEVVRVSRADRNSPDFALAELAPEQEIESQYAVNSIANTFKRLAMDDVRRADGAAPSAEDVTRVVLETFDGVRIRASLAQDGDQVAARLEAEFDEALVAKTDAGDAANTDAGDAAKTGAAATDPKDEVARWSAQWRDWVYVIPDYQFESIGVKKADLLKPPRETAEAAGEADADTAAGSQN